MTQPRRLINWLCGRRSLLLGDETRLMGIVNVTPDSFSDGGLWLDASSAVQHALQLADDGADILDIGGESTRPGSEPVTLVEELRRVLAVIDRLRPQTDKLISIDTTKAEVAHAAIDAGADIVNDISGLTVDPKMVEVCAQTGCGVICMHMQGTPQTMQTEPHYDDCVTEVTGYLEWRLSALEAAGVPRDRVVIDPGIGFGKTAQHNLELLTNIERLRSLGRPVLIGHSRKRFLAKILGRPIEERSAGTLGVSIAVAAQGADILRVHEVRETRDALLAWRMIARASQP